MHKALIHRLGGLSLPRKGVVRLTNRPTMTNDVYCGRKTMGARRFAPWMFRTGFSLTPYLESFAPTFGLGTPDFTRMSSNLHCGTPTFPKRYLWDSYFQNPSENPVVPETIRTLFWSICIQILVNSYPSPGHFVPWP